MNKVKIEKQIIGQSVATGKAVRADEVVQPVIEPEQPIIKKIDIFDKRLRSNPLPGFTYRIKPPTSEHALNLTLNNIELDGKVYLYEVFINTKNPEHQMYTDALTIMLSSLFKQAIVSEGFNLKKVISSLQEVYDAPYFAVVGEKRKHMNSLVGEIAYWILHHIEHNTKINHKEEAWYGEFMEGLIAEEKGTVDFKRVEGNKPVIGIECPDCWSHSCVMEQGCLVCKSCGWSKCG